MKIYRSRADVESAIDQEIDKRLDIVNKAHGSNYSKQYLLGDCCYQEEKTKFQFLDQEAFENAIDDLGDTIEDDMNHLISTITNEPNLC